MNSFLETSIVIFLSGIMGAGVYFSIEKRMYHVLFLFGGLFLICLISGIQITESFLIDDNALLQMNATVIAGALILMTISSLPMVIKVFKRGVLFSPLQIGAGIVGAFSVSIIFLLFNLIDAAKAIDFMGFVWVVISCLVVTMKDPMLKGESQ